MNYHCCVLKLDISIASCISVCFVVRLFVAELELRTTGDGIQTVDSACFTVPQTWSPP